MSGRGEGINPKDLVGARKAPLGVVPPALIIGAAEANWDGAVKYGAFNWRDYPVQVMTYIEAMLRHIAAFIDGEDVAQDSGVHHLKHVAAGCGILLDSIELGIVDDNRPTKGPAAKMLAAQDKSKDYSKERHTHSDDVSCAEAGDAGHPPRIRPGIDFPL